MNESTIAAIEVDGVRVEFDKPIQLDLGQLLAFIESLDRGPRKDAEWKKRRDALLKEYRGQRDVEGPHFEKVVASGTGLKFGHVWASGVEEAPEDLKVKKAEALRKVQEETLVALFDGDTQVTDWAPFAEGKAPVFDNWLDPRREHEQYHAMNSSTMRTQDGNKVRASTSVQEKVTKSYAITWRTTS